jgi:predicted MarR family transcription regulator
VEPEKDYFKKISSHKAVMVKVLAQGKTIICEHGANLRQVLLLQNEVNPTIAMQQLLTVAVLVLVVPVLS